MDKIHLKSPSNWINDPNGFIYYKGKYHLFYQHFPYAPVWGRMHWGHAVSDDLVTWEHKGIALYPTKKNDRSGCFSGSAVEHDGKMHIFYTGINYREEDPENINCALNYGFIASQMKIVSQDGYTFDNFNAKTTIIQPLHDSTSGSESDTRDPKVWRGSDAWYMIVGSTYDNNGRFLFFKSENLENWEYVNYCEKRGFGCIWECPDYFEVNGKGVVIFSPIGILDDNMIYDSAAICCFADFDEKSCKMTMSDEYSMFDYGIDLYAPQSNTDENGRRVVIAWARMPEAVGDNENKRIGMMCIPRVVDVRNNHIYFSPHPNIRKAFSKKSGKPSHKSGYMLKTAINNGESINIGGYIIRREDDIIITDRTAVFINDKNYRLIAKTPVVKEGNRLEIYVDSNLIEIYINDGEYVLSSVVYGLSDIIEGGEYEIFVTE